MKITPIASTGQVLGAAESTSGTSSMKMERARAIARGEVVREEEKPSEVAQPRPDIRKIKMQTQQSTSVSEPVEEQSSNPLPVEPATVEATQPLSPQFAAIAKQKRALQVKERELADREKALSEAQPKTGGEDLIARLKSQPLSVLQEHGVTYDQLTEAILSDQSGNNHELQALKAQIKALEEGVDKKFVDREVQQEEAALNEMSKEAERLSKEGDAFELVRETKSLPAVRELIKRTYKEQGEILDVSEALQLVEDALIEDSLKLASYKKVQGRLTPPPVQQLQPQQKQMRTLTARDTVTSSMSPKARALAAFAGTLRK